MSRDEWAEVAHVSPAPRPPVDVDEVVREQRERRRLEHLREFLLGPRSVTLRPDPRYL